MPLSSSIDLSHSENLHWLAVLGSSVVLSLISSIVPNFVEATLDVRSHNRSRLFNESTARLHIAYIIFLLALITSNDVNKSGNILIWLETFILVLVFIHFIAIIVSGRTITRIKRYKDWAGRVHECNAPDGICVTPIGWWVYCKVCLLNGLVAVAVGLICVCICATPYVIRHQDQPLETSSSDWAQQKPYNESLRRIYSQIAQQTEDEFEETVMRENQEELGNSDVYVSYWYMSKQDKILRQLATTHENTAGNTYDVNEGSIIGCAYSHANSTVRWDGHPPAMVWSFNQDKPVGNKLCGYKEVNTITFKSVICATYNDSASVNPEDTVGVCVFSPNVIRLPGNAYHDFLKKKAEGFYNGILPILQWSVSANHPS